MIYDDSYILKKSSALPVATYACDYGADGVPLFFSPHFHRDMELIFVDCGSIDVQILGNNFTANAGDIIIINPYEQHSGMALSGAYAHRCIDFDLSVVPIDQAEQLLSGKLGFKNHMVGAQNIKTFFDLCFDAAQNGCDELRIKGALMVMISMLEPPVLLDKYSAGGEFGAQIRNFLEENYTRDISSAEIAGIFSYNHSYFCRKFKRIFACSFGEYLNMFRVSKAREILPNIGVAETALAVGFTSLSYFSRVFKALTGTTPSEYKKIKEKYTDV